jgi:hypothetical protein
MAKIVTMRERVHQPFWDTVIRTSGFGLGNLGDNIPLFTPNGNRGDATTNLVNGATLPSDQSHVVLALRVFSWFRNSQLRVNGAVPPEVALNGDYGNLSPWLTGGAAVGTSAPGQIQDVYRLHYQTEEQLHWTFGTGEKPSISNMPTWYFPAGGGISGDMGGATDLIHWQNSGYDGHAGILRLARAILLPPRQNIQCKATIYALPDNGQSTIAGLTQASRNMLSLKDNLNAYDGINKVITFTFDGLFSRDVQ